MLSSALSRTVAFLKNISTGDNRVFIYDDWWEHDGLHLSRKDQLIDFDVLRRLIETPEAIKAAMTGEYEVCVGVASPDFQWYLRFYLEIDEVDNDGHRLPASDLIGRFDITLPHIQVDQYCEQVIAPLGLSVQVQESITYYLSVGMGSYEG